MIIIAGTSLTVYPAASFIDEFKGKYMVVINRDDIHRDMWVDLLINEDMTKVFEQIKVN